MFSLENSAGGGIDSTGEQFQRMMMMIMMPNPFFLATIRHAVRSCTQVEERAKEGIMIFYGHRNNLNHLTAKREKARLASPVRIGTPKKG